MHDELDRPLGLNRRKSKLSLARPGALAGITGLCLAIGAGAYLYSGLLDSGSEPAAPAARTTAAIAEPEPPAADTTGSVRREAQAETGFDRGDDDDAAFTTPEPEGSIVPLHPAPAIRRQELALAHMPDPALVERGATGVIPKRSADGERPMDVYSRPPATEGNFGVARIVIIVGGLGISQTSSQEAVRKLPGAVTLAFAPYGNSLSRWMQEARKHGHELLLQLPMEPFGYPANSPGPHTLSSEVSADENMVDLHWAMSRLTNYVGVMNFLGGKFVTSPAALKPVFDELAGRGLLFVDDGTVKNSVTEQVAQAALLPYARAWIVIDAERSRRAIAGRLDKLVQEAKRTGLAIGVANAFPDSIEMIAQFASNAGKLGIEITPVSSVVTDPERNGK